MNRSQLHFPYKTCINMDNFRSCVYQVLSTLATHLKCISALFFQNFNIYTFFFFLLSLNIISSFLLLNLQHHHFSYSTSWKSWQEEQSITITGKRNLWHHLLSTGGTRPKKGLGQFLLALQGKKALPHKLCLIKMIGEMRCTTVDIDFYSAKHLIAQI